MSSAAQQIGGPFFEDLHVGQIFDSAPAVTLTEGFAAVHAAILGDRMRLPLDPHLSRRVLDAQLAHPGFAWDMAIGQSTLVTHRVIANLFYRGFMYHRAPCIGDTLYSTTEIVGLRQNRSRPGRAATGLAALRMRTKDQEGRSVLDFFRCAMPTAIPDTTTTSTRLGENSIPTRCACRFEDGVSMNFGEPRAGYISRTSLPARYSRLRVATSYPRRLNSPASSSILRCRIMTPRLARAYASSMAAIRSGSPHRRRRVRCPTLSRSSHGTVVSI
jgi:acyl dehydratase